MTRRKTLLKNEATYNKDTHKPCSCCRLPKKTDKDFYTASSDIINIDGKLSICKQCLWDIYDNSENKKDTVKILMRMLDKPFLQESWDASFNGDYDNPFKEYMRRIAMPQNKNLTYDDSVFDNKNITDKSSQNKEKFEHEVDVELDKKNKEDVLRMLGYDPFEYESENDKRHLYNKLVDFLDESTLEDSFKLPAVIEIVKTFNQIDKINNALSQLVSDPSNIAKQTSGVKSLIDSKQKMLKSILDLAKDNGISVNHNNTKSKGAGTLSGIIKNLQEKGFEEVEVNLFDIETCKGMKQVANMSNESIMKQLQFDENDYAEMITEQRNIIENLDTKLMKLEEENRLLKKQMLSKNEGDNS